MAGKGGKTPGAGRKKGSKTKRTSKAAREAAAKAAESGELMPLQVLLKIMRQHEVAGLLQAAVDVAAIAAPYCHAKLSAVQVSGKDGGPLAVSFIEVVASDGTDRGSDEA